MHRHRQVRTRYFTYLAYRILILRHGPRCPSTAFGSRDISCTGLHHYIRAHRCMNDDRSDRLTVEGKPSCSIRQAGKRMPIEIAEKSQGFRLCQTDRMDRWRIRSAGDSTLSLSLSLSLSRNTGEPLKRSAFIAAARNRSRSSTSGCYFC